MIFKQKYWEVINAYMATGSKAEAALAVKGMSLAKVSTILACDEAQKFLADMSALAFMKLRANSHRAAQNVIDKQDSDNERISLDASKDNLDRVGVKAPTKINIGLQRMEELWNMQGGTVSIDVD